MNNSIGLVICNEQSGRGNNDKSLFNYHGTSQRYYLYEMLQSLCDDVFLSCHSEQAEGIPKEYNVIVTDEEYKDAGAMGALLTAFKKHPKANILVIGCTYPYINRHHLKKLTIANLETIPAITYYDKENEQYVPLIGMYHNNIKTVLRKHHKAGDNSLNNVLQEINAYTIKAKSQDIIHSVETQKEYKEVAELFKKFR